MCPHHSSLQTKAWGDRGVTLKCIPGELTHPGAEQKPFVAASHLYFRLSKMSQFSSYGTDKLFAQALSLII